MIDLDRLVSDAGHAVLAGISGLIAAALRKEAHSWKDYFLKMSGAALVGFLTAKMCRITGASEDLSYILSSLAGWLGAETVFRAFAAKFGEKLGIKDTPSNER